MDLEQLRQRHAELDRKIQQGYTDYLDDAHLQKMKFEKANLKRRIAEHENSTSN